MKNRGMREKTIFGRNVASAIFDVMFASIMIITIFWGLLPCTAHADEVTEVYNWSDLLDGSTIKSGNFILMDNIYPESSPSLNGATSIDLNGYRIVNPIMSLNESVNVGGTLIISDSGNMGLMHGFYLNVMSGGKIIVNSGKGVLLGTNLGTIIQYGGSIAEINSNKGTLTQNNGEIGYIYSNSGLVTQNGGVIYDYTDNGGTIVQTGGRNPDNFEITLDANGGTLTTTSASTITTTAGQKFSSLPAEPTASDDNHTFAGWFTEATAGTQITTDYVFTGATTIYARWTDTSSQSNPSTHSTTTTPTTTIIDISIANTNDETSTSEDTSQTFTKDFLEELDEKIKVAIDAGGPQTIYLNDVATLPITIMRELRDNPQLTVILDFTFDNVGYQIIIPGKNVVVDDTIPWYGPLYLNAHYGQYSSSSAASANVVTAPANGTYSVVNGDTLSAIASRLHTTVRHLMEANHIANPDQISIGQQINY